MKIRKFSVLFTLVVILSMMFAVGASAQSDDTNQDRVLEAPVLGSALLDYRVQDNQGELIGNIGGFVLDSSANQIHYLIVNTDNLFDPDRLVPWNAFQLVTMQVESEEPGMFNTRSQYDFESYTLSLPIDEETFDESAPAVEVDTFSDPRTELADASWDDDSSTFWSDYAEGISATGLPEEVNSEDLVYVATDLFSGIDYNVYDNNGDAIGEVEDYLISSDGLIPFGLVETDSFLGIGDELIVVSMDALRWDVENQVFYLNVEEGALEEAPRFDPLAMPDFLAPGWDTEWTQFWIIQLEDTDMTTPQPGMELTESPTSEIDMDATEEVTPEPGAEMSPEATSEVDLDLTEEPTSDTDIELTPLFTPTS